MSNDAPAKPPATRGRPPGIRTQSLSVSIPVEMLAEIRKEAAKLNVSVSSFIAGCIAENWKGIRP